MQSRKSITVRRPHRCAVDVFVQIYVLDFTMPHSHQTKMLSSAPTNRRDHRPCRRVTQEYLRTFWRKEGLFQACILRLCEQLTGPIDDVPANGNNLALQLHRLGVLFARISLGDRALELHRLMVAEGKRFPLLAQKIYQSGRKRGADIVASLIEGHRARFRASLTDTPSLDLAEMFVSLVINETQLYALTDLEHLSAYRKVSERRVKSAVQLFISGLLREV